MKHFDTIEGSVYAKPDFVYTKNGNSICKFVIILKNKKSIVISTWNKLADVCKKYLRKKSKIRVTGKNNKHGYFEAMSVEILEHKGV